MSQIKTSTALIIVLAVAVLIGGGALTWVYAIGMPDTDISIQSPIKVSKKTTTTATIPATTATTSATADWKTYTNTSAGYTIKYPANYKTSEVKTTVIAFGPTSGYEGSAPLSIDSYKPVPVSTLEQYIESETANSGIKDCAKTTLSGKVAYECLSLGMLNYYSIIADNNEYRCVLTFNSGNSDTLAQNKTALTSIQKLMLSTFKFTE